MPVINPDLPADGETADAADVNDVFNAILALINGGIDSDNLAANSVGTSEIADSAVTEAKLASTTKAGWYTGLNAPNTVAYNGNRSYTLTFNTTDYTGTISPGHRIRTTRSAVAPTQCTSLNGTSQYWVKTSPNKMAFTDDFVCSAWIKIAANPTAVAGIVSRYNATGNGFIFYLETNGSVNLRAYNAGGSNQSGVSSYQSVPINRWVHVAAQLDMSAFTATTTTSYVTFDGVDVPALVSRGGTNPTAFVQSGNLEVGSYAAGAFLAGKVAQAAVFNAKVTQSTLLGYISQGLSGSETNLASAWSFSNSVTDLNTTTPNDLSVGGGSAVATNADSPFGGQGNGSISSTLDYGIVQSVSFSTNTTMVVQVAEGCTIPTSGGVSTLVYSTIKAPYRFPLQRGKWVILSYFVGGASITASITDAVVTKTVMQLFLPIGEWRIDMNAHIGFANGIAQAWDTRYYLCESTAASAPAANTFELGGMGRFSQVQSGLYEEHPATAYVYKSVSSATTDSLYILAAAGASLTGGIRGVVDSILSAENAYL